MRDTQWFADCTWGVFCHYLAGEAGTPGQGLSAEEWNAQVNAFDVKGLAKQLESVGASYFFITLGQGSGHFCAPNETYDRLTGLQPSKCAKRDLISDLYEELEPRGIKLMLYSASELAWGDMEARPGLEITHNHNDLGPDGKKLGYKIWHQYRQVDMMKNMEAIHREWSERWGKKICGWWIDGCYEHEVRFPEGDPPNFETFAAALRTGNPDAIVTFNTGVKTPVVCNSIHEDYTAGEISRALPECPGPWVEKDGHKARYHLLSFLGDFWGEGEPRFPDEMVAGYTKYVTGKGGVVTWDVPIQKNGLLSENFLHQLSAVDRTLSRP
jgi:hypothetical protein